VLDSLTVALGTTEQDAILASRALQGQLVEGHGFTTGLQMKRQAKPIITGQSYQVDDRAVEKFACQVVPCAY